MPKEDEVFKADQTGVLLSPERFATIQMLVRALTANIEYPETSQEVTKYGVVFREGVIEALQVFKDKKTGQRPIEDRFAALKELVAVLSSIYGNIAPELAMEEIDGSSSGSSYCDQAANRIVMRGKLSIITLLHEFCHARGMDERQAVGWSTSLFKRVYPKQYAKLFHQGHTLTETIEATPPTQGPAVPEPIRVVVCIEDGVCTDVACNVPIKMLVIDNRIEEIDGANRIIRLGSDDLRQDYQVYCGCHEGNLNTDYVNEVFSAVEAMENRRQAA